ncbi:MAG: hypothetical protein ACREHD_24505, partial [Pirellulales bacterium]
SYAGYLKMQRYALQAFRDQGMEYNIATGGQCVGFTIDTMDQADLFPKYYPMMWSSGQDLWLSITGMDDAVKLPNCDVGSFGVALWQAIKPY